METTNHLKTWGRKPRLVGENRINSNRWEVNVPNEGSGHTNPGIWSAVVRMKNLKVGKFLTSPTVAAGNTGHCAPERVVHARCAGIPDIACLRDAGGYSEGSHCTDRRHFS
ncbi:hypothetical protein TNCV_2296701 [Trichonephila clavipes]|nr:hypothetical protein TNCV_2296701 [Trichonephila clavipes]